jgi:hypothetical protein
VVDRVVVEVDGALDQTEAEQPLAEGPIGLCGVDGRGDVMEVPDRVLHAVSRNADRKSVIEVTTPPDRRLYVRAVWGGWSTDDGIHLR